MRSLAFGSFGSKYDGETDPELRAGYAREWAAGREARRPPVVGMSKASRP